MVLVNTWRPEGSGPTYYFHGGPNRGNTNSRVDYILLPRVHLPKVTNFRVNYTKGVLAQLGNPTIHPTDHLPVSLEIPWPRLHVRPKRAPTVDQDLLARTVDGLEPELFKEVTEWMEAEFQGSRDARIQINTNC